MSKPQPSPAILQEASRQHAILSQGTSAIYPEKGIHGPDGLFDKLVKALTEKRPLRIKFGMDPTAPDLHLGHSVVLARLRAFQDLGHTIQPLIGDYTARIGDPSGRNKTRPPLTGEEIDNNAQTYFNQLFKVVKNDPATLQVLYNGQWLKQLSFAETIKLCAQVTVSQILEREDFDNRYKNEIPISMHELLYPIMQGYDSVAMECDIEFGGTDQTFNCLMGRKLMQAREMEPQVVMTFPLLEGTDGSEKMSKSKGNTIGLTDSAQDMFGKTMSIPDEIMPRWFNLLTTIPEAGRPSHPMEAKKLLARTITTQYHSEAEAIQAQEQFERLFSQRKTTAEDFPVVAISNQVANYYSLLIDELGWEKSKSALKRQVAAGALKINGEKINAEALEAPLTQTGFNISYGKLNRAHITR